MPFFRDHVRIEHTLFEGALVVHDGAIETDHEVAERFREA
jgi:hypothetical protein